MKTTPSFDPIHTAQHNEQKAFWQLGFRPFFCCASVYALLVMPLWLAVLQGVTFSGLQHYGQQLWHVHEMVFGYALAVIAGFLLTAIKNWTGIQTARMGHLKLLFGLWLLGRLMPFIPQLPAWVLAVCDSLFALALLWYVATPLIQARNRRNHKMIFMIAVLAGLNVFIQTALLLKLPHWAMQANLLAMFLVLLLVAVMAGRVFPMFSQNGVAVKYQAKVYPLIEKAWPLAYIPLVIMLCFFRGAAWSNGPILLLSLLNAILHSVRLVGWYDPQIWYKPLVWVLHVGYGFFVFGFMASAFAVAKPAVYSLALHCFTIGALGLITLGMMARVSLGHTGRNLHQPPGFLFWCFWGLVVATLSRVLLPLTGLMPYAWTLGASVVFWVLAFAAFVVHYAPIWWRPRIDGKPG